ncbi:hypothetical protein Tco_0213456 [Tanacetum coccineum]
MAEQQQNQQQQQDRPDEEFVPITNQVRIGISNFRIALEKPQPNVIYKLFTYNLEAKTYFFTLDDQSFEVNAELLRQALQIIPKVSNHPFVQPPPKDEIISFIKNLGYPGSLNQVSNMRLQSFHHVIKLDIVLGNLKFANKGEKDPIYGMAIPMEMTSSIKGLITKKGVKVVVEKIETVRVPKKKCTEIVIKKTGQSKEVAETIDSEEIEDEEEDRVIRRQVIIGRGVNKE